MKNKIIQAIVAAAVCTGCISCVGNIFPEKGNGKLVTSEKRVSAFDDAKVSGNADVRFYESREYRVVVTVDENLEEYVDIFTKNNVLNIRTKKGHNVKFTEYRVDIYAPFLTGVSMSGSGSFEGMDAITASTLDLDVSGSGEIRAVIECGKFSAGISGSGKITVAGNSRDADIDISGSGKFNGGEFGADNASVGISGSGQANIHVIDRLNAEISGSGTIRYLGNPVIKSNIKGSGKIKRID